MAWTAHTDPEQIKEHRELEESVERKAETMAHWIKESQNFIIFTGAGVSTSAGIPDFRGPTGVWTLRAQGKETTGGTSSLKAIPTPTHMSIVALTNLGLNKYLISQNTDGLHRKSGIHPEKLSELHGNTNLEICERCGKQYLRDFHTRTAHDVHEHLTGRHCTKCDGNLQDSIINFGESLPQIPMQRAFNWASKADLCLVLGSSLTVTPAADMPRMVAQHGGKLVICNLQKTPLDNIAALRVFASSDDFMKQVMNKLDLEIPEWRLHRRVIIGNTYNAEAKTWSVYVRGIDVDGTPVSFLRSVTIQGSGFRTDLDKEPFETRYFPSNLGITPVNEIALQVSLKFMGFYMEPELTVDYTAKLREPVGAFYHLEYHPFRREWRTETEKQFSFSDFKQWGNRELLNKLAVLKVDTRGATERQDLLNLISMNYKGT